MSDLIDRQEAIDTIDKLSDEPIGYLEAAIDALEDLPSAQPEIIRCKDCKYYYSYWGRCRHWERISTESILVAENDFCSRAERRTDEQGD